MTSTSEQLRGFGPLGILAILVILAGNLIVVPLSAILVLVWARRSRTPWREIGYVRPESWIRDVAVGIVFGIAFKLADEGDRDAAARRRPDQSGVPLPGRKHGRAARQCCSP